MAEAGSREMEPMLTTRLAVPINCHWRFKDNFCLVIQHFTMSCVMHATCKSYLIFIAGNGLIRVAYKSASSMNLNQLMQLEVKFICFTTLSMHLGKSFRRFLKKHSFTPSKLKGSYILEFLQNLIFHRSYNMVLAESIMVIIKLDFVVPPGVESRLAMLALDIDSLNKFFKLGNRPDLPSSLQPVHIPQIATTLAAAFNMLNYRRAIIPAANGHCSARALARYYAALVDGGVVPPPHSSSSKPPLGSHPYMPKFSPQNSLKEQQDPNQNQEDVESGNHSDDRFTKLVDHDTDPSSNYGGKIFRNSRIHDAFMGVGEYGNLVKPDGKFGLGFRRFISKEGSLIGFGHPGMGGSTGFCDIQNRFAISVTLSKLSFGDVTASIIHLVCSELNIPVPEEYLGFIKMGADAQLNLERPLIN
ncbi:uncharacterized protein LOC107420691 isoform X2 [Ziziphus jujuba]|uniref:Uncharacterized protein LOC107420691 isoform X2 n=1 Tax=Ziziphus jujuba TaxID=326968 RepID=A0ABM4AAI7_ZIZJJ|nr:uncharacterized protein LOC107420691 isoform X2 [Ziziphus jujuba]